MSLMRAAGYEPEAFPCAKTFSIPSRRARTDCLIADVQDARHRAGWSCTDSSSNRDTQYLRF